MRPRHQPGLCIRRARCKLHPCCTCICPEADSQKIPPALALLLILPRSNSDFRPLRASQSVPTSAAERPGRRPAKSPSISASARLPTAVGISTASSSLDSQAESASIWPIRALRLTLKAGERYARPETWLLRMTGPLTRVSHGRDRELPPREHHMPRTANRAGMQHSVHHAAGYGTFAAAVARASGVA